MSFSLPKPLSTMALAPVLLALFAVPAASAATGPAFERGKIAHGSANSIVVVGGDFAVARLRFGGSRDLSFGADGLATARFPRRTGSPLPERAVRRAGSR